jgi:hypothetical protein
MRTFIKRMKGAGLRHVIGVMSMICRLSAVMINAQVDMTKRVQELKDLRWEIFFRLTLYPTMKGNCVKWTFIR